MAAHGFTFCITNGHTKKEFSATHKHGRAKGRISDIDELANTLALYERANVKAFAPGGAVILDIDKHGADGLATLASAGHEIPQTLTETTPTDGQHLYYLLPDDCVGWVGNLTAAAHKLAGVELMSGPNFGALIAGGIIRGVGNYTLTNDATVAPAPAWIVELIQADMREAERKRIERETRAAALAGAQLITTKNKRTEAWARGAMFKECAALTNTPKGQRNDQLNRAAFVLGQLTPHYLTADEVGRALLAVALRWDGTKESSEARKIDKAIERGATSPRYLTDAEKQDEARGAVGAMRMARANYRGWGGAVMIEPPQPRRNTTTPDSITPKLRRAPLPNVLAVVDAALDRAERVGRIDIELSVRLTAELGRMGKTSAHTALRGAAAIDLLCLTSEAYESKGNTYTLNIAGFMELLRGGIDTTGANDITEQLSSKSHNWDKIAGGDKEDYDKTGQIHTTHPRMLICPSCETLDEGGKNAPIGAVVGAEAVTLATVGRWVDLGAFERAFNRVWRHPETGDEMAHVSYLGLGAGPRVVCEILAKFGPMGADDLMGHTGTKRATLFRQLGKLVDAGILARADGDCYTFTPGANGAVMALVSGGDTSATRHKRRHDRHETERATYHHHLEQKRADDEAKARGDVVTPYDDQPEAEPAATPESMRVILPTVRTGKAERPSERIQAGGATLRGRLVDLALIGGR